ncbi:MAG: TIM barrel protein, partial [Phycisphaerales bacterium]
MGVCSWSLRPTSPSDLVEKVRACGLSAVQLALDPIRTGAWDLHATWNTLSGAGITILSGMVGTHGEDYTTLETIKATGGLRPTAHWGSNLRAAESSAAIARTLGIRLVTFHAGFLPHDHHDPERALLIRRLAAYTRVFAAHGVRLAFETGQERAETLLEVLAELQAELRVPSLFGVNFDPANMLLYGMGDPIDSLARLAPWVRQVHIKDASPTAHPGTWGTEQPAGAGAVDWPAFFRTLGTRVRPCDLLIEREDGASREADVRQARALIERHVMARPAAPLRVGVVGLGFMGRTHVAAIASAQAAGFPCVLAAVADREPSRLTGTAAPVPGNLQTGGGSAAITAGVRTFIDPMVLIESDAVDALCICTHTDTHAPLARAALAAGKHVLVEKPVALACAEIEQIAVAAHGAGRLCMPAMCMRFWPGWTTLAQAVRDGRFGALHSAAFQRLGARPDWAPHFYTDPARSGGAQADLHVHDVDFINGLLGPPRDIRAAGTIDHLSSHFLYGPGGPAHVSAEGSQALARGSSFRMRFVAVFEAATLDFDLSRPHPLELTRDGTTTPVEISTLSA